MSELLMVAEEVAALRRRLAELERVEAPRQNHGSAFPASWPVGVPFYRTDLRMWASWDGTRWLSATESILCLKARSSTTPVDIPIRLDYAPYVTRVVVTTNVAAPNNASNNYTVAIQSVNAALSAADNLLVFATNADTAGTETVRDSAPGGQVATNRTFFRYFHTITTGAPGAITSAATIYYRLILT